MDWAASRHRDRMIKRRLTRNDRASPNHVEIAVADTMREMSILPDVWSRGLNPTSTTNPAAAGRLIG